MSEQNNLAIRYTAEDIDRVFMERVTVHPRPAALKPGIVCEWSFEYPNGQRTVQVDCAFYIDPKNNNYATGCEVCNEKIKNKLWEMSGCEVCNEKIKNKLWEMCGQYSLISGQKL